MIAALSASWTLSSIQNQNIPTYTTNYSNLTPQQAYNLVYNNSEALIIVDMRNCDCSYNKGHISGAIWQINPETFYNSVMDILVYGEDDQSLIYCQKLVGHVYGAIYHLDGGIEAWESAGYHITKT